MDFGKKYMQRIFIYSSVFLGMYLFYAAFLLLSFFDIVSFSFSTVFNLICIFDIIIVIGIIITMFHYGADINEQFIENKLQLIKIKQMLIYVKYNLDLILSEAKFASAYMKIF